MPQVTFLNRCPLSKPWVMTNLFRYQKFGLLFFFFLWPHPWHIQVPRLGGQNGLQLSAYTTATAMSDLSYVCDLHHSLRQCWILNPLNKARN